MTAQNLQPLVIDDNPVTTAPADTLPPAPRQVSSYLAAQIQGLSREEQLLLATMIGRAKSNGHTARPFDVVSFVHQNLRALTDLSQHVPQDEIEAAVAPPMVKFWAGAASIPLPEDLLPLDGGLRQTLSSRFSGRNFSTQPLTLSEVGSLLQYSFGFKGFQKAYNTKEFPLRTAPSSGGLQSNDLYIVANAVDGAPQGLYYFDPVRRALIERDQGNMRSRFLRCCMFQDWIAHAPMVVIMVCNMPRVTWKYGPRAYRFAHVDTGVLTQNLYLVGTALNLNTCAAAAFFDDPVNEFLEIDGYTEFVSLLFVVGHKPTLLIG